MQRVFYCSKAAKSAKSVNVKSASFLVDHYTAPALAKGFMDREHTLRKCAQLLQQKEYAKLENLLLPYYEHRVDADDKESTSSSLSSAFRPRHLELIKKRLFRLPRQLSKVSKYRASVVIPLCHAKGEPSILYTLRSNQVGKHKGEICFPGGM